MRRLLLLLVLVAAACREPPPTRERTQAPAAPEAAEAGPAPVGKLDRSHAGRAAPETPFEAPDGKAVTLAGFRGKPLLVNLWATWCAPCVKEMPAIDRLAGNRRDRLRVVAISQDMNGRDKVDAFFEQQGLKVLERYMDGKLALMSALDVEVLPTTILYDAEGREVWRRTGEEDWSGPRAARLIDEGLRGRRG